MLVQARQDLIAGICVTAFGMAITVHSWLAYDIGTPGRMGPGFFPFCLGLCMVALGLPIAAFGARSDPIQLRIDFGPFAAVLASMAIFALVLPLFGLLPATVLLVAVCLLGSCLPRPVATLLTVAGVAALAILVFKFGLNIQLPILRWPF